MLAIAERIKTKNTELRIKEALNVSAVEALVSALQIMTPDETVWVQCENREERCSYTCKSDF